MKFRIMENGSGKYVQKKIFGIWWNWFVFSNSFSLFKLYYDSSASDIEYTIKQNNKIPTVIPTAIPTKLLKEFEV